MLYNFQDDLELHYSGFHTPHFHNLSDLVEQNLASQVGYGISVQIIQLYTFLCNARMWLWIFFSVFP